MKKQGTGYRVQGSGVGDERPDAMERLLREAMAPVGENAELGRDLWPEMQRRLRQEAAPAARLRMVPWFDWALAGGLAVFVVVAPVSVPVLLYYL